LTIAERTLQSQKRLIEEIPGPTEKARVTPNGVDGADRLPARAGSDHAPLHIPRCETVEAVGRVGPLGSQRVCHGAELLTGNEPLAADLDLEPALRIREQLRIEAPDCRRSLADLQLEDAVEECDARMRLLVQQPWIAANESELPGSVPVVSSHTAGLDFKLLV
jgi:hypothetical protein